MEKILEQALLYDFYGELLTQHQRSVYEDAVCNDMSLGEIAGERGISRQGVHDMIKRCDRILQDYEEKLHLVQKYTEAKEKIKELVLLTEKQEPEEAWEKGQEALAEMSVQERMTRIRELSLELLKEW